MKLSYLYQIAFFICATLIACSANATTRVWVLDVNGAIGPAVADYMIRGIEEADQAGADLVVIRMDTPGGLDKSMRDMIKAILNSPVPIATYVFPEGARAASAGTYILYASHIAAMSPATNLGAATPVQIGAPSFPTPQPPEQQPPAQTLEKQTPDADQPSDQAQVTEEKPKTDDDIIPGSTATERKVLNDAVAYIKGLAEMRGRNAEWATKAVVDAASLPSTQALEKNVIDVIAIDIDDLLQQVNGREVELKDKTVTLNTDQVDISYHQPDWHSKFLAVITDPNVAYILILIGMYGLIFEFSNPGLGVPGIVGAICVLLALYAFQVLPISYTGLGLMLLGVLLMVAEAFVPSFGVLGLGGVVAFIFGSIMLMDTDIPAYQIAMPVIVALAVASAAIVFLVIGMLLRTRRRAVVSGLSSLQGLSAPIEAIHNGQAMARLEGELWQVESDSALSVGDEVKVKTAEGVVLHVEKLRGES